MPVIINGNGTVDTGTVLVGNSDITGLAAGALPSTVIGAGAVLQVVSQQAPANYTSTSSDLTLLTQSFTPTSATSKVLAIMSVVCERTGGGTTGNYIMISLKRDGSTIVSSWANALGYQLSTGARGVGAHTYLDSPATTSAVSYTYSGNFSSSGNVQWDMYSIQLTLLEIAV